MASPPGVPEPPVRGNDDGNWADETGERRPGSPLPSALPSSLLGAASPGQALQVWAGHKPLPTDLRRGSSQGQL